MLVTLVGPEVGGSDAVGIYRVEGPDRFSVVADLGAFSIANPPATDFFVPSGVQYALHAYRGGFLVTDGHHNRVLRVTEGGQISQLRAFANIVPTGLEVRGRTIYLAEAGPVPEGSTALPDTGALVKANRDGTFGVVIDQLNQPTSLEFIGKTAYVVTLGGEIWKINNI